MMTLMTSLIPIGSHLGGWRHPEAWSHTAMNLDHAIRIAQTAERGKFDMLFLADGNAVRHMDHPDLFAAVSRSARPTAFEPTTLLAALSQHTRHIGLFATATTTYEEPYMLARRFASLDHLSGGRAVWNVVTSGYEGDAENFSRTVHVPRAERYERCREVIDICRGLWDSWAEDAFIEDKESGRYLDPAKVQRLNHAGKYFGVRGPLNVARPPQGHPILCTAGQSEEGLELAAEIADTMFSVAAEKPAAQAFYADVKGRMAKYGRTPDQLRIIPGVTVFLGRTEAEAHALYAELQELITPALGLAFLSSFFKHDFSGYADDDPMPELSLERGIGTSSYRIMAAQTLRREKMTVREAYKRFAPMQGNLCIIGDPVQVADTLEEWYRDGACDGFNIGAPVLPRCLDLFVELVVPELQRRGIFRTEYAGRTLRETMGLARPARRLHRKEELV